MYLYICGHDDCLSEIKNTFIVINPCIKLTYKNTMMQITQHLIDRVIPDGPLLATNRPAPSLPTHASIKSLCNSFSSHFKDKISLIHSAFTDHTSDTINADSPQLNSKLTSFELATTTEVRKIIMSSPSKSCDLDPLPTILLKTCLDVLIKPITDIINASLCSGLFPEDFKCAHVNPILKKTTLSKEDLNSYRPISNVSFISKILEKVVANRLTSHININGLTNASQSAYKQFHSTETALLKVHNDINLNIDNGKITALTLLDLSAAFDTIDHDILITCLSTWYGISGTALSWFTSYLTDRRQAIKIGNCFSDLLWCPPGFCFGSVAFHSVHNTIKLSYPES